MALTTRITTQCITTRTIRDTSIINDYLKDSKSNTNNKDNTVSIFGFENVVKPLTLAC